MSLALPNVRLSLWEEYGGVEIHKDGEVKVWNFEF
jgi:hypothetical protein